MSKKFHGAGLSTLNEALDLQNEVNVSLSAEFMSTKIYHLAKSRVSGNPEFAWNKQGAQSGPKVFISVDS